MKKFSDIALEKCALVINAILEHPFNRELAEGSLHKEKFAYYIEQDAWYLRDFAKSLAMIGSKAPSKFFKDFLSFSEAAWISEQEVVHDYFRKTTHLQETGKLTPATLCYTSYLLCMSATAPVEVAIAAVLPCFLVYKILGDSIAHHSAIESQHPYRRWIETYSGKEFSESVEKAKTILDELALLASDAVRLAMLEAFYQSTVLEWHFWNDAYNQTIFDACHNHACA